MEYDWNDWREKAKEERGEEQEVALLPDGAEVPAVARYSKEGKTGKGDDKVTIKFEISRGAYEDKILWFTLNFPKSGRAFDFFERTLKSLGVELTGKMTPAEIALAIRTAAAPVTLVTELGEYKNEPTTNIKYINAGIVGEEEEGVVASDELETVLETEDEESPF